MSRRTPEIDGTLPLRGSSSQGGIGPADPDMTGVGAMERWVRDTQAVEASVMIRLASSACALAADYEPFRWLGRFLSMCVVLGWVAARAFSQELDAVAPPLLLSSDQQLMIEQVEELVRADELDEAILQLNSLLDHGAGAITPVGAVQQAGTLTVQPYVPVGQWSMNRLRLLLARHPKIQADYDSDNIELAEAAWDQACSTMDIETSRQAAQRYFGTSKGPELGALLADIYLERGWTLAAVAALEEMSPELRFGIDSAGREGTLPWWLFWGGSDVGSNEMEVASQAWSQRITGSRPLDADVLVDVLSRYMLAAALDPQVLDLEAVLAWANHVASTLEAGYQERLLNEISKIRTWESPGKTTDSWSTFGGNPSRSHETDRRLELSFWPNWSRTLERYRATTDRTPASEPRAGESEVGTLPFHPVVRDGKVFVNALNRINAYDLATGEGWPVTRPRRPLFDSQIAAATYIPIGYPLVGTPRGTLALLNGCLYARMGPAVTGWVNQKPDGEIGSSSYLVGLDLRRQGSLLRGFPLHLKPPQFSEVAEFDGPPLPWGIYCLPRSSKGITWGFAGV